MRLHNVHAHQRVFRKAFAATAAGLVTLSCITAPAPAGADANTCIQGYVWRNARNGDAVCVTSAVRDRTAQENATAADRREPNGGAYGPNTCKQGFVWREAFDGDAVCVTPDIRDQTKADNAAAASRTAANTPKCFTSEGGLRDSLYGTYDSCTAQVRLEYPNHPWESRDHYNIAFGQRPKSDEGLGPIFSGQWERDADKPPVVLFGTRPKEIPVVAYFRIQDCEPGNFGTSDCLLWSSPVTIELGNNELTAR